MPASRELLFQLHLTDDIFVVAEDGKDPEVRYALSEDESALLSAHGRRNETYLPIIVGPVARLLRDKNPAGEGQYCSAQFGMDDRIVVTLRPMPSKPNLKIRIELTKDVAQRMVTMHDAIFPLMTATFDTARRNPRGSFRGQLRALIDSYAQPPPENRAPTRPDPGAMEPFDPVALMEQVRAERGSDRASSGTDTETEADHPAAEPSVSEAGVYLDALSSPP